MLIPSIGKPSSRQGISFLETPLLKWIWKAVCQEADVVNMEVTKELGDGWGPDSVLGGLLALE
jgi:hypothetical protein